MERSFFICVRAKIPDSVAWQIGPGRSRLAVNKPDPYRVKGEGSVVVAASVDLDEADHGRFRRINSLLAGDGV
jgi:hypothetical protein